MDISNTDVRIPLITLIVHTLLFAIAAVVYAFLADDRGVAFSVGCALTAFVFILAHPHTEVHDDVL